MATKSVKPKKTKDVFDIEKIFTLSTAHISDNDEERLRNIADSGEKPLSFAVIPLNDLGYLITIEDMYFTKKGVPKITRDGYDTKEEITYDFNLSEHFLKLLSTSIKHGCRHVKLSVEGQKYDSLKVF